MCVRSFVFRPRRFDWPQGSTNCPTILLLLVQEQRFAEIKKKAINVPTVCLMGNRLDIIAAIRLEIQHDVTKTER